MNLNIKQVIAIVVAVLSVLSGSTAQLTDLLGPGAAKVVISCASLTMSVLSSILAVITSQGSTIKDVASMPGVEKITVNDQANQVLATMAVDPTVDKIAPTPAAIDTVTKTAEGATK